MENKKELGNVEDTEEIKDLKENSADQVVYEPRYWIITSIAVLITAILVGGGLWWYMNGKIMNETTELKQKISDLENQILSDKIDQDVIAGDVGTSESEMNNDDVEAISTSDWQTYSNEEFEFEMQYPVDWNISELNDRINFMAPGAQDVSFVIFVSDESIDQTRSSLPIFNVPGREVSSETNVTINDIDWLKLVLDTQYQVVLLAQNNGKTYVAQYSTFKDDIGPSIVSTLKFTE